MLLWASSLGIAGAILLVFSVRKVPRGPVKFAFLASVLSGLSWVYLVLLNRILPLSDVQHLWLGRTSLTTSILLVNAISIFGFVFIGRLRSVIQKPLTWVFALASLVGFAACFSNYVVRSVTINEPIVSIDFGPFYSYVLGLIFIQGIYITFTLWHSYKRSHDDLLKVQLKFVFYGILTVFFLCMFSYIIIPLFYGGVSYIPIGPFSFIVLFAWLAYILAQEHKLLIRNYLWKLLRMPELKTANALSFAHLVSTLGQTLKGKVDQDMRFDFKSEQSGAAYELRLRPKLQPQIEFEKFEPKLLVDNKLLPIKPTGFLKQRELLPENLESYEPEKYRAAIEKNIEYTNLHFGEELICFSKASIAALRQLIGFADLSWPISFVGQTGTGRTAWARALHFYRHASNLTELSCHSPSITERLEKEIQKILTQDTAGHPGLLIKDLEALSTENIVLLKDLLEEGTLKRRYIYFTALPEIYEKTEADKHYIIKRILELQISLASLPYRKEDIFYQIMHLCLYKAPSMKRRIDSISGALISAAMNYKWQNNFSQLNSLFTRAIWEAQDDRITADALTELQEEGNAGGPAGLSPLEEGERQIIINVYRENTYNKSHTAKELGISLNTLKSKIKKYNISER